MVWWYAHVWSVAQTTGLSIESFSPKHIDHAVGDRSEESFIKCNLWKAYRSHIGWSNTSVAHQKLTKIQNSHVQTQVPHIAIQTDVFST